MMRLLPPLDERKGVCAAMILMACVLAGSRLAAHDMWIEPTVFFPEVGNVTGVRLRVGQDFLGDPIPRDPALIDQFIVIDAAGRKPVVGRDGADPAGLVRLTAPGLAIIGFRSNPSPVVLTAEKFNQYLKDEGLDVVAALRAERGQTKEGAREIFTRCAKSLLLSGSAGEGQADRPLGFTLEVVAERNPYSLRPGDVLPVRLTFETRALAGALVVAMNRSNPAAKLSARTDKEGRVRFRLPEAGVWLVKAVHMIPAAEGTSAEWASYWASSTFQLRSGVHGDSK